MDQKKLNALAVGAFLSAVAVSMREAGDRKERQLIKRMNEHLDSLAEDASPLSQEGRAHLHVIRSSFEAYRKNPLLASH